MTRHTIKRLLLVCIVILSVAVHAVADNTVSIGSVEGSPGDTVTLQIGMTNTDNVSSVQLSIPIDQCVEVVANSAQATDRTNNHSVTAGVKDGKLNIFVYSISMSDIAPGTGTIATVKLKLGNDPSSIVLSADKTVLTDSNGSAIAGATATDGNVTISCAKIEYSILTIDYGRVPIRSSYQQSVRISNVGNATLIISGAQFTAGEFSCSETFPLEIAAGSSKDVVIGYAPTERGSITEEVKFTTNSVYKLNTLKLQAQPFAVNELHVESASGIADSIITITLRMNNMDAITGFQFDFNMPEQLEYIDGSFALSDRKADHLLTVSKNDRALRALAYSLSDSPFTGDNGTIATFKVRLSGRYSTSLGAQKAVLTANIKDKETDVLSDKYDGYITIKSPRLSTVGQIDMGRTPITQDAHASFNIRNYGSAPLYIERIVSSSEHLKVNNALPIVIESWGTAEVDVILDDTDERDYDERLQLYTNDPDLRMHNIKVTGNRYSPNYITLSAAKVVPGDTLRLQVALSNNDPVNGLQFDLQYDKDKFELLDGCESSERATGYSATNRDIENGKVRFFCYSLGGNEIAKGDGDVITLLFASNNSTPVGNYSFIVDNILLSTAGLVDKYSGNGNSVEVSVVKPTLTISAGNYTKKQGDAMPEFKASYSGFRNGDTEAVLTKKPVISTKATVASAPGEYAVTISGAEADSYEISYVPGKLTVVEADPVIVRAKSCTRAYGDANPGFEFETEGAALDGVPEITCVANPTSGAGTYDIEVKKGTIKNYNVTYVAGTLTVTKAPLTISAGNYTKKQGDAMPKFAASYSGFKNNETEVVLTKKPTITTEATVTSAPDDYAVTASGAEAQNYDISYMPGTLTVTQADAVIIRVKNSTRAYGDANPTFEFETEGAALDGVPEITCFANAKSGVGTYDIEVKQGTVKNYNVTYVAGTLTVTKAQLTISAGNYTMKQGNAMPKFAACYSGFKNGETEAVLTKKPVFTTSATVTSEPGEYEVSVSGAEAQNYSISYLPGTLTIKEKSSQAIKWNKDIEPTAGSTIAMDATASSGLSVTYIYCQYEETLSSGYAIYYKKANISGNKVTFPECGQYMIIATQLGNDDYVAVSDTLEVNVLRSADDLMLINGIYYKYTDKTQTALKVVSGYKLYSGDIVIPESENGKNVVSIDDDAMYNCRRLNSVVIGKNIENIPQSCFSDCRNLSSVTLNASLQSMDMYAFCRTSLEEIHCGASTPYQDAESAFHDADLDYENCVLYVPTGSVSAYASDSFWGKFANIVEEEPVGIAGVNAEAKNQYNGWFTIGGMKLLAAPKAGGVYIHNGKKVLVR